MSSTRRHRNRMGLWGHLSGSLCAIIVMILVTGCGSTGTSRIAAPLPSGLMNDAEKQRVQSVMAEISERNRTVEDDPNWIKLAYDTPMIRKLEDIDESKYTDFRQYLAGDAVYIIVHPGYNTFFHSSEVYSAGAADAPADSAMDRYLRHRYYSARYQLIQSQEKRVRDFLEFASTERRLVILLLPGNYRQYREYNYLKDNDEYLRYINGPFSPL